MDQKNENRALEAKNGRDANGPPAWRAKYDAFNLEFEAFLRQGMKQIDAFERASEKFAFPCYTSLESFKTIRSRLMRVK